MKVLLFGGSGQLGFEILKRGHDLNFEIVAPVASEVNVSDRDQVLFLAHNLKPEVVLNCAAYTAVDKAEEEKAKAYLINCDGAGFVAEAAQAINAFIIHISTDYVFDGRGSGPINEDAATNPISVYGASKLAGEEKVREWCPNNSLILRTSSLHGQKGINFVHTMLRLFNEQELVRVVNDQFMTPTWAGWLSEAILDLARIRHSGVLHAACSGVITWYDFATTIYELVKPKLHPKHVRLEPISVSELARPAKRPAYSALDCSRLAAVLKRKPIAWQVGLQAHLREIGSL